MTEPGKEVLESGNAGESPEMVSEMIYSQRSLQDFLDCQRRFKLRYLDKLRWPAVTTEPIDEFERLTEIGIRFHQMVHRERSGVPSELILENTREEILIAWFNHYLSKFPRPDRGNAYSELTLAAGWNQRWRLTATCDLIMYSPTDGFRIVDWKTTRRKPDRSTLRNRVQTSLYPLLFTEVGGGLFPGKQLFQEGVEIMYWFPAFPDEPEVFSYTSDQAHQDKQRFRLLIEEIAEKITEKEVFPKTEHQKRCRFCVYRSFCGRGVQAGTLDERLVDVLSELELDLEFEDLDLEEIDPLSY